MYGEEGRLDEAYALLGCEVVRRREVHISFRCGGLGVAVGLVWCGEAGQSAGDELHDSMVSEVLGVETGKRYSYHKTRWAVPANTIPRRLPHIRLILRWIKNGIFHVHVREEFFRERNEVLLPYTYTHPATPQSITYTRSVVELEYEGLNVRGRALENGPSHNRFDVHDACGIVWDAEEVVVGWVVPRLDGVA